MIELFLMTVIRRIDYVISILTEPVDDFTFPNEVRQAKLLFVCHENFHFHSGNDIFTVISVCGLCNGGDNFEIETYSLECYRNSHIPKCTVQKRLQENNRNSTMHMYF